jgi:hypothetical protein
MSARARHGQQGRRYDQGTKILECTSGVWFHIQRVQRELTNDQTLEEIRSLPFSSLSQTPFLEHIFASLPSLRAQVKDAVTSEHKSWLFSIREVTGEVGGLALGAVQERTKRWKVRREKESLTYASRVGCAVELVTNEKVECERLSPLGCSRVGYISDL